MALKSRHFIRLMSTAPKLKDYTQLPGIGKLDFVKFAFNADLKKGLENTAAIWQEYGDMCKIEIPFRPPIVMLFDPDDCEKVYRASGAQPIRPGFDALK